MVHVRNATSILMVATVIIVAAGLCAPISRTVLQGSSFSQESYSHIADVSPSIYDWDIVGRANQGEPFSVWANVTDDDDDLANVSVHVNGPNMTLQRLMPFNGSLYVTNLDALVEIGVYDIFVTATDYANNTRYGRHLHIEIASNTTELPDPNITMPYVVISSLGAGALVTIIAYLYGRKYVEKTTQEGQTIRI
jgi:hypothetical protein